MKQKLKTFNNAKFSISDIVLMGVLFVSVVVLFVMSMKSIGDTSDAINKSEQSSEKLAVNTLQEKTIQRAEAINAVFEAKFQVLEYIATLPEIKNMKYAEQYDFIKGHEQEMGFDEVFVVTAGGEGRYIATNSRINQSGEQFITDIMAVDRFITDPFQDSTDRSITTICVSVYKGSKKVGVLCGKMDLNDIVKIVEEDEDVKMNEGFAAVLNDSGRYIASAQSEKVYKNLKISEDEEFTDASKYDVKFITDNLKSEENSVSGSVKLDGNKYYSCMVPIENCSWKLVLTQKVEESTLSIESVKYTQIASIIILLVIIGVALNIVLKLINKERVAYIDQLTGIANRARCSIIMDKLEMDRSESIMVVSFDLNDFKAINDEFGHKAGDDALKTFGKILNRTFGRNGFVARMGGDEFIAILVDTSQAEYERLIDAMKKGVSDANADRNQKYTISPSYGNAIREAEAPESETVLKIYELADKKMYVYKETYKAMRSGAI